MAIDTKMTDELLLAMLIAQNGDTKGRIVFNQTKSCGLANWNPATNGEAAREQAFQQSMLLARPGRDYEVSDTYLWYEKIMIGGFWIGVIALIAYVGYLTSRLVGVYTVQSFLSDAPAILKSFLPLLAVIAVCVIIVKVCES